MAGSYVDVPSRRMATDADGCVGVTVDNGWPTGGGIVTDLSAAVMDIMSAEDNAGSGPFVFNSGGSFIGMVFPELRELDGWYASLDDPSATWGNSLHSSGDTTNANDGTWTSRGSGLGVTDETLPDYRESIESLAVSSVRGIRIKPSAAGGGGGFLNRFHVYGEISAGETPDRLLWFDDDDDLEFSLPVDYGDVPRGSAEDHVTYLKNNSASLTANSVQVTAEDNFQGSGAWYTFDDGTGFASTKALASGIANGANSPNITIRRVIPDAEVLGLHAARAFASHASFT